LSARTGRRTAAATAALGIPLERVFGFVRTAILYIFSGLFEATWFFDVGFAMWGVFVKSSGFVIGAFFVNPSANEV